MILATHGASHEGRGVTPMHGSKVIIFYFFYFFFAVSRHLSRLRSRLHSRRRTCSRTKGEGFVVDLPYQMHSNYES